MIKWKQIRTKENAKVYVVKHGGKYITLSELAAMFNGCYYEILYSRFKYHVMTGSGKFNTIEEFTEVAKDKRMYKYSGQPATLPKVKVQDENVEAKKELSKIMNDDILFMKPESGPRIKELQHIIHGNK